MTDISLAGISLASAVPEALVLRVVRPLLGNRRDTFVEVPGRESSWRFVEEPGDRILSVDLDLQALTFAERRAAVTAIADWADTLAGAVPLIVDDQPDRSWSASLIDPPDPAEWLTRAEFPLSFRVGPYAEATAVSTHLVSGSGGTFSDTWSAPDEVISWPVVELVPTGGTLLTFSLTLNGETVSVTETIAAAGAISISSISSLVTFGPNDDSNLTGVWDPADLRMSAVAGDFGAILPGANAFQLDYTGTAASVAATITWRRRFR